MTINIRSRYVMWFSCFFSFSCKLILHESFEFFEFFHVNKWVVCLIDKLIFWLDVLIWCVVSKWCVKLWWYWRQSIKMQKDRNLHMISTINVEKSFHCWRCVKSSIHVYSRSFSEYAYFLLRLAKFESM